jgi:hypothetical protein
MADRVYRDVRFEFVLAHTKRWDLSGTVRRSAGSMSLRIDVPGDRPYAIRGVMRRAGYFSGRHRGRSSDAAVRARWRRVGVLWLGVWVEEGVEYVFAFLLSSPSATNDPLLDPADQFYGLNPDEIAELPVDLPAEAYALMEEAVDRDIADWANRMTQLLEQHGVRKRRDSVRRRRQPRRGR